MIAIFEGRHPEDLVLLRNRQTPIMFPKIDFLASDQKTLGSENQIEAANNIRYGATIIAKVLP